MKENTLLKIALISSLIGLIALYFISDKLDIKHYSLTKINSNVGDDVKLKGIVKNVRKSDKVTFIEVEQNVPSNIVVLGRENINITSGDFVEVIGEVQEYKGGEEIIANRIRVVK